MIRKTPDASSAAKTKQTGSEEIETKPKKVRSFQGYSINWMKLSKSDSFINNVIDYLKSCWDPVYREKIQNEFFEYMKKEVESGKVHFLDNVPEGDLSAIQRQNLKEISEAMEKKVASDALEKKAISDATEKKAVSDAMEKMTEPGFGPDSVVTGDYSGIHNEFHQGKINTQQYLEKIVGQALDEFDKHKNLKFAKKSFENLEKEISKFFKEEGANAISQDKKDRLMDLIDRKKSYKLYRGDLRSIFEGLERNERQLQLNKGVYGHERPLNKFIFLKDSINRLIKNRYDSKELVELEKDFTKYLERPEYAKLFSPEEKADLLNLFTINKLGGELVLSIGTEFQNCPLPLSPLFDKLGFEINEIILKYETFPASSMDELAELKIDYMKELIAKAKQTLGTDETAIVWLNQTVEKILIAPQPGFTEEQKQEIVGMLK